MSPKRSLCEIGGGSGQLAWALAQSGYENLELLEPNGHWTTGTGYLETVLKDCNDQLRICNDLTLWYASEDIFSAVVTRNCVHHFPNIAMTAACIRQKLGKGGRWVMINEWYAETPTELYANLRSHPYCQKYLVYEFPYPPKHYSDCLEYAGFKLIGVVPAGYANNAMSVGALDEGNRNTRRRTKLQSGLLKRFPRMSVMLFRLQSFLNCHFRFHLRSYARPQVMIFERVELDSTL